MDNDKVLDLTASGERSHQNMRSSVKKERVINPYNSGQSKAEESRILSVSKSTLQGCVKEAASQDLLAHASMSSSESSPYSPGSKQSAKSDGPISLADSDDEAPLVINLGDEEKVQPKDYAKSSDKATPNASNKAPSTNNTQKEYLSESKRLADEMMQLLALHEKNLQPTTEAAPVTGKRKRESQGYSEEARNVTQDWLQLQQQHQQMTTPNPDWQQLLQKNVASDPKLQQILLQQQLMQQTNPFANQAMAQQWQQIQQIYLLAQLMQHSQNQQNSTPQPGNKGRKIVPKPTHEAANGSPAVAQNLSMASATAAQPNGQSTVSPAAPSLIPLEFKHKRKRRSKLEMAMLRQGLNTSGAGQQQQQTEQLSASSPNSTQVKPSTKKTPEVDPMAEWNAYFDAEYFMLHDYLLVKQQAIGQKITACSISNQSRMP